MTCLDKDRKRNQIISFRLSSEEKKKFESRVKISGLPKGEFIIKSILRYELIVIGGKFQSDRLSLEIKRLRENLEEFQSEEITMDIIKECNILLEELLLLLKCTVEKELKNNGT